jgi:hypothetical protein
VNVTSRKKPGIAFWATVVVVAVLVGYPLSFGPACWIATRTGAGYTAVCIIYWPLARLCQNSPRFVWTMTRAYARSGMAVGFDVDDLSQMDSTDSGEWEFVVVTPDYLH